MKPMDPEFREFYESEFGPVVRTVFLLCRDHELAEDVTQEAFVRALERWPRLRDHSWRGGWVTTTALNIVRRRLRRRRPVPGDRTEEGPDADVARELWFQVAQLPMRQRQAIVLHYRLGLPVREIASAMGCTESAVRAHLTRARTRLRTLIEEELNAGA